MQDTDASVRAVTVFLRETVLYKEVISPLFRWMLILVCHPSRDKEIEDVKGQTAAENIWNFARGREKRLQRRV